MMKKRKFMRFVSMLSILSCLLFVLPVFSACSNAENKEGGNAPETKNDIPADDAGALPEGSDIPPEIPAKDMGGKNIKILTAEWGDYTPLHVEDIVSEQLTGEPLNDAAYNRQITIEEAYNCEIVRIAEKDSSEAAKKLQRSVLAQDDSYDIALIRGREFAQLIPGNYLYDLNELRYFGINNPWWKKNAYDALAIGGKHFGVCGDFSTTEMKAVWTACFNKAMIQENGMESPYNLVKEGTWTLSKAAEMAKQVARDLDGNDKMNAKDLWGINYTYDTVIGVLNAGGVKIAELDPEGIPGITIDTAANISKIQNIFELLFNREYSADTLSAPISLSGQDGKIFGEGNCLFIFAAAHNVNELRAMDTDFGIIPYPKYDESQPNYLPGTCGIFLTIACVPKSNADTENTSLFMEAFAREGGKTVVSAFYDTILKNKMARDVDSEEMLDYIFGNIIFDAGNLFNFGGFTVDLCNMSQKTDTNIASFIEKNKPVMEAAIANILDEISK